MTFYQNGGRVFFSQSMATQADDNSPMVWTSGDIIDVFVLNSNLLNKHKHIAFWTNERWLPLVSKSCTYYPIIGVYVYIQPVPPSCN